MAPITAGRMPSRTSVKPKTASSAATTTSQTAASPEPPPSAAPWMRPTSGTGSVSRRAEQRRGRVGVADVLLARVVAHPLHPGQIGAGAEDGPGAGDHRDPRLAGVGGLGHVGGPGAERRDQPLVEGVADGGPVERRAPDRPLPIDQQHVGRRKTRVMRHMRNTPNRVGASGAFSAAASARPRVSRVDAGSRMPSSHSRAVE